MTMLLTPTANAESTLAMLEKKASLVITLGEEMSNLLESEIELLISRDRDGYGKLVTRKQKMLVDYQGAVKALMSDREAFSTLSPERRAQLKATGAKLDAVAQQNSEKLSMTAAATHKVLQVVIDTVRKESLANKPQAYHPSQFTNYRDERAPTAAPVFIAEKA